MHLTHDRQPQNLDSRANVAHLGNMLQTSPEPDLLSLGDYLRQKREGLAESDRTFSLRQMATRCGITAAYLSRVERDELPPPGEDTLCKLAQELGEDQDVLLAMAGKISTDLRTIIMSRPKLFADLIRSIKSMPDHAVLKIVREVRDGEW
jgi:transcriptional regulator with XRE-family HTH domain